MSGSYWISYLRMDYVSIGVECSDIGAVNALHLAGNYINGTIPATVCQLKSLISIDLSNNNISGYIPSCFSSFSNLQILDLSRNVLSGTIPSELFLIKRLRRLSLSRNQFSGEITIPDVKLDSNLAEIDLSDNSFNGSIPYGIFNFKQLNYLSLGYDNLSGRLPEIMSLLSLQGGLNLTHNSFCGNISTSYKFSGLIYLDFLERRSEDITKNLIPFVSNSRLRIIWLSDNKFWGKIVYEFLKQPYMIGNCFDDSNLCSDSTAGLHGCPSKLCNPEYNIQSSLLYCKGKPDKRDHKHLYIIIISVIVGCGIVGFLIPCYLARKCTKMMHGRKEILPLEVNKLENEWKMISFQKLDFTETDILSSLTNDNLIGNGGSGSVYRVVINDTVTVAVKSISNERKSNKCLEKEFMAEVETLGIIRHYNIVKLLCCISGRNVKLLVYLYFQNKSLDQWLHCSSASSSNTKLNWPKRLHIAIGAAQGLSYMHHDCYPPIIHRDIKSSNILLDTEFNAKIADFGLAKMLTVRGGPETASVVAGTFGYIAPEYAYTAKVDVKTDVYSFGVVLLELTTGRKATSREDHMNLAERVHMHHMETNDIDNSILDDEIKEESSNMDQILAVFRLGIMCTTKSPSNRPSMKDCLNILQNCCISS